MEDKEEPKEEETRVLDHWYIPPTPEPQYPWFPWGPILY